MLYIFWFLHQTTTLLAMVWAMARCISFDSYIKPQRSGNSVFVIRSCISFDSYIKPQPLTRLYFISFRCISFDSYIKPQPDSEYSRFRVVVYLLIPTSNHNSERMKKFIEMLYIFWFLHQTTTQSVWRSLSRCCISFDSYIKPQLCCRYIIKVLVVYLLIPTSNHNRGIKPLVLHSVVYLLIPTSNHNYGWNRSWNQQLYIFWFLHQTTTCWLRQPYLLELYIFWFLHQTTTFSPVIRGYNCCISFDSYIKPQLSYAFCKFQYVVYLLIPTSNHNCGYVVNYTYTLYIFWFLHQTTTLHLVRHLRIVLYIFWFLHQTTTCI